MVCDTARAALCARRYNASLGVSSCAEFAAAAVDGCALHRAAALAHCPLACRLGCGALAREPAVSILESVHID
eukprot:COSAG01_NODE_1476_length_10188_cov_16.029537_4_plen_73_part_00